MFTKLRNSVTGTELITLNHFGSFGQITPFEFTLGPLEVEKFFTNSDACLWGLIGLRVFIVPASGRFCLFGMPCLLAVDFYGCDLWMDNAFVFIASHIVGEIL